MKYVVGLVEYGQATHKWVFDDYPDALHQLRVLTEAYDEVNGVCPVFLKVRSVQVDISLDTLLKQYSYLPKVSPNCYE